MQKTLKLLKKKHNYKITGKDSKNKNKEYLFIIKNKNNMSIQIYEKYWSLTLEYTDINGEPFRGTLQIIVDFIDKNPSPYSEEKYLALQKIVFSKFPKVDMASIRKSINQFVKLGFINFHLESYHIKTKNFLSAQTNRKRQSIFSYIVYTNSSFNRSVTKDSKEREINFLIKTLEENGKLHKTEVMSLMTVDISEEGKRYLTQEELISLKVEIKDNNFWERKYNQVSYFWGLLKKLDDLIIINDYLYFEEDAQIIFGSDFKEDNIRDRYLHRIYKNQLKEESKENLGDIKCMLEKLTYPTLVASHIKPFKKSSDEEAYDPDNGLLLSQNMDGLFDKGYISFNNDGSIILSNKLDTDLKLYLSKYTLDNIFIRDERKKYLDYHRELFKEKLEI